ncbi:MAG: hypothetical protein ABF377_01125 [Akkermansiaceae bacterium]
MNLDAVKIFRIKPDIDHCQWAMPSSKDFVPNRGLVFEGRSRMTTWNPHEYYIHNPILEKGDFFHVGAGCIAFGEKVWNCDRMVDSLEMDGEILPITFETEEGLYILNVTECVNALDKEKSEYSVYWDIEKNMQAKGSVKRCAFHPDCLTGSSFF